MGLRHQSLAISFNITSSQLYIADTREKLFFFETLLDSLCLLINQSTIYYFIRFSQFFSFPSFADERCLQLHKASSGASLFQVFWIYWRTPHYRILMWWFTNPIALRDLNIGFFLSRGWEHKVLIFSVIFFF